MRKWCWLAVMMVTLILITCDNVRSANSPIGKGSWMVGGGGAFSSMGGALYEDGNGNGISVILLYPQAGFFVANGVAVGSQFLYARGTDGESGISAYGIGPKVTYFFDSGNRNAPVKEKMYPFLTTSLLLAKLTADDSDEEIKFTGFVIGGGIDYMIANSIGMYSEINYRTDKITDQYDSGKDSSSGHSINIFVGFNLFLWE